MAAPRDRIMAEAVKAYAAAHGLSERQGRRDRNANTERWQAFVRKWGGEAAKKIRAGEPVAAAEAAAVQILSPASPVEVSPPEFRWQPDEKLSPAELMVKQAWQIYDESRKAWKAAFQEGDAMKAMAMGQAVIKAQASYYQAQARLQAWEAETRRVVPLAEVQALLAEFVLPLGALLENCTVELAVAMNPNDTAFALRQGESYKEQRIVPVVKRAIEAFDAYDSAA